MLIDKGLSPLDIITLKLSSGEELIARLADENPTHYKVTTPLVLGDTGKGIGMYPYLITAGTDRQVPINKSLVAVAILTDDAYADAYQKNTSSIQVM